MIYSFLHILPFLCVIELFTGKIGAGKTYLAVCRCLGHVARGGVIFTNIEFVFDKCAEYCAQEYGVEIQPEQFNELKEDDIENFQRCLPMGTAELPILCIVDEAHLWFGSKDHRTTDARSAQMLRFLSQSRKLFIDFGAIVQHEADLDGRFKRQAEWTWFMKDLQKIRVPVLGLQYPFPHILAFQVGSNGMINDRRFIRKDPRIWAAYRSYALLRPVELAGDVRSPLRLKRKEKAKVFAVAQERFERFKLAFRPASKVNIAGAVALAVVIMALKLWVNISF